SAPHALANIPNKADYTHQGWAAGGAGLGGVVPLPGTALIIRLFGDLEQKVNLIGDQLDTVFRFGSGRTRHEMVVGIEAQQLKVESSVEIGLLPPIDLMNPVETAQAPIVFLPGAGFGVDLQVRTLAPYVL